jgi:YihY family inner membrane protein
VNPVERIIRHVDAWQQRHRVPAFGFAVFKKFGDDQAGNQVALLTYFAFLATFPLLLALVGILGIVLKNNPGLQQRIVSSSFGQFPIIGTQLHSQLGTSALPHSGIALIIGLVGAILGGRGLANAVQNALNTLWNVPKIDRPGFPSGYLRTFGLLGLLGVGAVLTAVASTIAGAGRFLGLSGVPIQILGLLISTIIDAGLFLAAFRLATAKTVPTRDLRLSAVLSAIAWQILLAFAGLIIRHYLSHATAVAGTFGIVLGLLAWFGLQATITIYLIEADVVRARRLWPRSITQPPLTDADKQFLHAATDTETRRPEQHVDVNFTPDADRDPLRDPGN